MNILLTHMNLPGLPIHGGASQGDRAIAARGHEVRAPRPLCEPSSAGVRLAQIRAIVDVFRANVRANAACGPRPGGVRLTLFRSRTSPEPTNGGSSLAGEPVEVHEMAADPYSMLVPPAVAGLADRLRCCIERALAAAPRAADGPPVAFVPQALEARS
jgi:hypothetical protein